MHLWVPYFFTKEARIYNGAKIASSINGAGKTGQLRVKVRPELDSKGTSTQALLLGLLGAEASLSAGIGLTGDAWGLVYAGGTASNMIVSDYCRLQVAGVVDGVQVGVGAYLNVTSGSAKNATFSAGYLNVTGGTVTDFTFNEYAGLMVTLSPTNGVYVSGTMDDGSDILVSDGRISGFTVKNNGSITVASGGEASDLLVSKGGVLVSSGGVLNGAVFSGIETSYGYTSGGGVLYLSGGTANDVTFSGGAGLWMNGGGVLHGVDVHKTSVNVNGGTVDTVRLTSGGHMVLSNGATASGIALTAVKVNGGTVDTVRLTSVAAPAQVHGISQARILEWVAISIQPCGRCQMLCPLSLV